MSTAMVYPGQTGGIQTASFDISHMNPGRGMRRRGVPLTDEQRAQRHYARYGTSVLPPRGSGLRRLQGGNPILSSAMTEIADDVILPYMMEYPGDKMSPRRITDYVNKHLPKGHRQKTVEYVEKCLRYLQSAGDVLQLNDMWVGLHGGEGWQSNPRKAPLGTMWCDKCKRTRRVESVENWPNHKVYLLSCGHHHMEIGGGKMNPKNPKRPVYATPENMRKYQGRPGLIMYSPYTREEYSADINDYFMAPPGHRFKDSTGHVMVLGEHVPATVRRLK